MVDHPPGFGPQGPARSASDYLLPPLSVILLGTALGAVALTHRVSARDERPLPSSTSGHMRAEARSEAGRRLSPVFRPEVLHWRDSIERWSAAAGVDPDLAGVVMQIESCGDPRAISRSGALGLFQVMPFHFGSDENGLDPDTNAARALAYLGRSLEAAGGDARTALAGYNGGISVAQWDEAMWPEQTQRYVRYGWPLYEDAMRGSVPSAALEAWYYRYGVSLCRQAAARLGLP